MFAMTSNSSQGLDGPARRGNRRENQKGFSLPELVLTMTAVGAILSPVLDAVDSSMDSIHAEQNQTILETAREALIRYAVRNDGCLPFAADWEGGLANTDHNGAIGYTDTGVAKNNARSGDLPWTDLGLGDSFRDGDGLRIQYYVASQYADFGSGCEASARGEDWNQLVAYEGTVSDPVYLYFTPPGGSRGLYEIDDTLAAGTRPDDGFSQVGISLPVNLLELRRGPDIKANGTESDVLSAQNVFVLIATGDNINPNNSIGLPYMRDDNHRANGSGGAPWNLNQNNIDDVRFSATRDYNGDDEGASGDDMLLVTSFLSFKSDLRSFGVKMESIY